MKKLFVKICKSEPSKSRSIKRRGIFCGYKIFLRSAAAITVFFFTITTNTTAFAMRAEQPAEGKNIMQANASAQGRHTFDFLSNINIFAQDEPLQIRMNAVRSCLQYLIDLGPEEETLKNSLKKAFLECEVGKTGKTLLKLSLQNNAVDEQLLRQFTENIPHERIGWIARRFIGAFLYPQRRGAYLYPHRDPHSSILLYILAQKIRARSELAKRTGKDNFYGERSLYIYSGYSDLPVLEALAGFDVDSFEPQPEAINFTDQIKQGDGSIVIHDSGNVAEKINTFGDESVEHITMINAIRNKFLKQDDLPQLAQAVLRIVKNNGTIFVTEKEREYVEKAAEKMGLKLEIFENKIPTLHTDEFGRVLRFFPETAGTIFIVTKKDRFAEMPKDNWVAIQLMAGKGTRLNSTPDMPKSARVVAGKPIALHTSELMKQLGIPLIAVIGFGRHKMREILGDEGLIYAVQGTNDGQGQLGVSHAIMQAMAGLRNFKGHVLFCPGDVVGIDKELIERLQDTHKIDTGKPVGMTLVTTFVDNPYGYGRIVRGLDGSVKQIVSQKYIDELTDKGGTLKLNDGSELEGEKLSQIREIDTAVFAFDADVFSDILKQVRHKDRSETYLWTDIMDIFDECGYEVRTVVEKDAEKVEGINTFAQMADRDRYMRQRDNLPMLPLKAAVIIGTRPELEKLAPVIHALKIQPELFECHTIFTGQHKKDVIQPFIDTFDLEWGGYNLELAAGTLNQRQADLIRMLEPLLTEISPDVVICQGDTLTAKVTAETAWQLESPLRGKVKVAHVEAGLRSWDIHAPYPEEFYRKSIDAIADMVFCPTGLSKSNLEREARDARLSVHVVGNTIVDALEYASKKEYSLPFDLPADKKIIVATFHRTENIGRPMENVVLSLIELAQRHKDIFVVAPLHVSGPDIKLAAQRLNGYENIKVTEPLEYGQMLSLLSKCWLILTDSGGIQEQAPYFKKPVLILRDKTERPEVLLAGSGILTGTDRENIVSNVERLLKDGAEYRRMTEVENPFGDGRSSERIAQAILHQMGISFDGIPAMPPEEFISPVDRSINNANATGDKNPLIISIDGPAGSGTSTVGKGLADRLNAAFLSVGEIYRLLAVMALLDEVDLKDIKTISSMLDSDISFEPKEGKWIICYKGEPVPADLQSRLRFAETEETGQRLAAVIRDRVLDFCKKVALDTHNNGVDLVIEGRKEIRTIAADSIKFSLTAPLYARLKRKDSDFTQRDKTDEENINAWLQKKGFDLNKFDDTVETIDTSYLSEEDVTGRIVSRISQVYAEQGAGYLRTGDYDSALLYLSRAADADTDNIKLLSFLWGIRNYGRPSEQAVSESVIDNRDAGLLAENYLKFHEQSSEITLVNLTSPSYPVIYEPLGLEILHAEISRRYEFYGKFRPNILDMQAGLSTDDIFNYINAKRPAIIGLSLRLGTYEPARKLLDRIFSEDLGNYAPLVMLGSSIPTYAAEELLKKYPKAVLVSGEGETAITQILKNIEDINRNRDSLTHIPSLIFINQAGRLVRTQRQPADLRDVAVADRTHMLLLKKKGRMVYALAESSRGCGKKCSFCERETFRAGKGWEPYPVKRVVDELQDLAALGVTDVNFIDEDYVGQDVTRARLIAEEIMKRGLKIRYMFSTRADNIYDISEGEQKSAYREDSYRTMMDSGLRKIFVGIESGARMQRQRYAKGLRKGSLEGALKRLNGLQLVDLEPGYIAFDPRMTLDELENSATFMEQAALTDTGSRLLGALRLQKDTDYLKTIMRRRPDLLTGEFDIDFVSYGYRFEDKDVEWVHGAFEQWENEQYEFVYGIQSTIRQGPLGTEEMNDAERLAFGFLLEFRHIDLEFIKSLIKLVKTQQTSDLDTVFADFRKKREDIKERFSASVVAASAKGAPTQAELKNVENAAIDIIGTDNYDGLVKLLRWPDRQQAESVVKNMLSSLAWLAKRKGINLKDKNAIYNFLDNILNPYAIFVGSGSGSRAVEEDLWRRHLALVDGYNTSFKHAIEAFSFGNRPRVASIDYVTAYHLLNFTRIDDATKQSIISKVRGNWDSILHETGLKDNRLTRGILNAIIDVLNKNLSYAYHPFQEQDTADTARQIEALLEDSSLPPNAAEGIKTEIELIIFKTLIEFNNYGEENPYLDIYDKEDFIGRDVLLAVARPYGSFEAYQAGYDRLKRQWKLGLLPQSHFIFASPSEYAPATLDKYPDIFSYMLFTICSLDNPPEDELPVIGIGTKAPIDTPEGKGHVIVPEKDGFSPFVPVVLEWKDMPEERRAKSRQTWEKMQKGEAVEEPVALNATLFVFDHEWFAQQFNTLRSEYRHIAKGKKEWYWTNVLDIRSRQHYQELENNPHTPTRVKKIDFGNVQPPSGLKDKARIAKYAVERRDMILRILKGMRGLEIDEDAEIVFSSSNADFKPQRDLAEIFDTDHEKPIRLSGDIYIERGVKIKKGAHLDGTKMPVRLRGNVTVDGGICLEAVETEKPDNIVFRKDIRLPEKYAGFTLYSAPTNGVSLTQAHKDLLRQRGIFISDRTKVTIWGKRVDNISGEQQLLDILYDIFGSTIGGKKVTEQIYLSGEEIRIEDTVKIENGVSLRYGDLRGATIAGRGVVLEFVKAQDAIFNGHPRLDSWSYRPPHIRHSKISAGEFKNTIIEYGGWLTDRYQIHTTDAYITKNNERIAMDKNTLALLRLFRLNTEDELMKTLCTMTPDAATPEEINALFTAGAVAGAFVQGDLYGTNDWDAMKEWRVNKVTYNELLEFGKGEAVKTGITDESHINDFAKNFADEEINRVKPYVQNLLNAGLRATGKNLQYYLTNNQINEAIRIVIKTALTGEEAAKSYNPRQLTNKTANEIAVNIENERQAKPDLKTRCMEAIGSGIVDFNNPALRKELEEKGLQFIGEHFKKMGYVGLIINFWDDYKNEVLDAKRPVSEVYLPDNNGEIVFDLLFIQDKLATNPDLTVHLVPKDGQYFDDASWQDVEDILAQNEMFNNLRALEGKRFFVHHCGPKTQGIDGSRISTKLARLFSESDVVFAKGQANFEMLRGLNKPVYYGFIVKGATTQTITGINSGFDKFVLLRVGPGEFAFDDYKAKVQRRSTDLPEALRLAEEKPFEIAGFTALEYAFRTQPGSIANSLGIFSMQNIAYILSDTGNYIEMVKAIREKERYDIVSVGGGSCVFVNGCAVAFLGLGYAAIACSSDNGGLDAQMRTSLLPVFGHTIPCGDITNAFKGLMGYWESLIYETRGWALTDEEFNGTVIFNPEEKNNFLNEIAALNTFQARTKRVIDIYKAKMHEFGVEITPAFMNFEKEIINLARLVDKHNILINGRKDSGLNINEVSIRHAAFYAMMIELDAYNEQRKIIDKDRFGLGLYLLEKALGIHGRIAVPSLDYQELYAEWHRPDGTVAWTSDEKGEEALKLRPQLARGGQVNISLVSDEKTDGTRLSVFRLHPEPQKAAEIQPYEETSEILSHVRKGGIVSIGPSSTVVSTGPSLVLLKNQLKSLKGKANRVLILNNTYNTETNTFKEKGLKGFIEFLELITEGPISGIIDYIIVNSEYGDTQPDLQKALRDKGDTVSTYKERGHIIVTAQEADNIEREYGVKIMQAPLARLSYKMRRTTQDPLAQFEGHPWAIHDAEKLAQIYNQILQPQNQTARALGEVGLIIGQPDFKDKQLDELIAREFAGIEQDRIFFAGDLDEAMVYKNIFEGRIVAIINYTGDDSLTGKIKDEFPGIKVINFAPVSARGIGTSV